MTTCKCYVGNYVEPCHEVLASSSRVIKFHSQMHITSKIRSETFDCFINIWKVPIIELFNYYNGP